MPPTRGRVLGASTGATQTSSSALNKSIAALKDIANQLAATGAQLRAELGSNKQVIVSYSGPAQVTPVSTQTFAQGQRIDQLSNTTISNPTITGGSISGSSISGASIVGTITNAIQSALATIDDLTSNTITATNVTFTNATTTALATANLRVSTLDCTGYGNGGKLTTDASGNVSCAADQGGAGSTVAGSDTQVQFNSGGGFAAAASFTFSSSTGRLAVPYASTTAFSALGFAYFGTASTTNLIVSGAARLYHGLRGL